MPWARGVQMLLEPAELVREVQDSVRSDVEMRGGLAEGREEDSDHYTGMAIDLMISDAGGDATIGGREIAEWVMRNRNDLKLKYVIWGQRIWSNEVGSSDKVVGWPAWRNLGDRESITANHWDHVHVSFK
ncbi:hypothetical protein PRZ48_007383 [Zasmidium cellare]|uniref:ARB-07466-like C-terminal domain-containing protein n=1 Tax=Zasmidium cellare TaxID=395010 RepID=A0ABR0EJ67_ZASCE|nr:hypothetical protein PRZ48_007383 [Zasmidium cellare]